MFRWLGSLLGKFQSSERAAAAWVEPSNAITRAVLTGAVPQLALSEPVRPPAEVTELPERETPAAPATRTAQRTRRRRAGRAA